MRRDGEWFRNRPIADGRRCLTSDATSKAYATFFSFTLRGECW